MDSEQAGPFEIARKLISKTVIRLVSLLHKMDWSCAALLYYACRKFFELQENENP